MLLVRSLRSRTKLGNTALHRRRQFSRRPGFRFFQRLLIRPIVMRDAVARDNHPRTIFAFMTMDEHGRLRAVFQHGECFLNLLLRGYSPGVELQVNVAHTQRLDYLFFPGRLLGGSTEVQHRLDTKLGQRSKPIRRRLAATENLRLHLLKIGYARSVLANRKWQCAEHNQYAGNSPSSISGEDCVVHAFSIAIEIPDGEARKNLS